MKKFRNGVSFYTTGTVNLKIGFPEDEVFCLHCWLCYQDSIGRHMCRLMNREVYFSHSGIHEDCPLEFGGENESI